MAVNKLDISMMEDVGTSANQLVQRDGSGNLPAIDGSQLTNVDSGFTQSASSPATNTNPSGGVGTVWYNTTTGNAYVCTNATTNSNVWRNFGLGIRPIPIWFGGRGCFGGGNLIGGSNAHSDTIDYITISTPGNATDFGDLIRNGENMTGSFSNGTRGIFSGGYWRDSANNQAIKDDIDYVTIATTGNATDFGNMTGGRFNVGAASNGVRGLFAGGHFGGWTQVNTIEYITIATTGNGTDFGDMTQAPQRPQGCSNGIRGVFAGGAINAGANEVNTIEYVTIASVGNATDFGDLTRARSSHGACSDETRGIWAAGNAGASEYNEMDFVTLATTGDATDFGNLTSARNHACSCSNGITGVWAGGGNCVTTIDCVRIATIGNATDFGDLTVGRVGFGACSGN